MQATSPGGPGPLSTMLAERDLILVTGKGGTGKSTLVAALAELAARRRGGALAVELSAHPRLPGMLGGSKGVEALNLDAEEIVGTVAGRVVALPLVGRMMRNRVVRMFIRTSPAIREMIVLEELRHLVEQNAPRGCPVIVDLPATGHALSFLDTPRAVQRTLRIGPLAEVAARVDRLLHDAGRCELVVIALPEELPINETIELLRRAAEIGVAGRTVVVNQVPAAPPGRGDRELLDLLQHDRDLVLGRLVEVARGAFAGADQARAQIDRLRALGIETIELPRYPASSRGCVETIAEALGS